MLYNKNVFRTIPYKEKHLYITCRTPLAENGFKKSVGI